MLLENREAENTQEQTTTDDKQRQKGSKGHADQTGGTAWRGRSAEGLTVIIDVFRAFLWNAI